MLSLILLILPNFGLLYFALYLTLRKLIKVCCRQQRVFIAHNDDDDGDEDEQAPLLQQGEDDHNLIADRLLNPEGYNQQ